MHLIFKKFLINELVNKYRKDSYDFLLLHNHLLQVNIDTPRFSNNFEISYQLKLKISKNLEIKIDIREWKQEIRVGWKNSY